MQRLGDLEIDQDLAFERRGWRIQRVGWVVMLLVVAETTQLLIVTLVGLDILHSLVKLRVPGVERWIDGTPLVLLEEGKLHRDRMRKVRLDESDILERGGAISIIPRRGDR